MNMVSPELIDFQRNVNLDEDSLHLQGGVIVLTGRSSEAERSRSKLANCLVVNKKYVLFCQI